MPSFHRLSRPPRILVAGEPISWHGEIERVAREALERERNRRPVFDGMVLCVDRVDDEPGGTTSFVARPAPYRYLLAQLTLGTLPGDRLLRPLAVSGWLEWRGSTLVGRRSSEVTQFPGRWELVPSGSLSLEHVDQAGIGHPATQLMDELEQELGVSRGVVTSVAAEGWVGEADGHTIDLCYRITVRPDFDGTFRGSAEYDALELIPRGELAAFTARAGNHLVDTSRTWMASAPNR